MEKHPVDKQFLRQGKDYTTLVCYKKAVIIYDITYYFAHKYLERGDRTIDQMYRLHARASKTLWRATSTASHLPRWR